MQHKPAFRPATTLAQALTLALALAPGFMPAPVLAAPPVVSPTTAATIGRAQEMIVMTNGTATEDWQAAEALQGTWRVTEIDEEPPATGAEVALTVTGEDVLAAGGCNWFDTRMQVSGNQLRLSPLSSRTNSRCSTEIMETETAFLQALGVLQGFEIAADGTLLLRSATRVLIRATR